MEEENSFQEIISTQLYKPLEIIRDIRENKDENKTNDENSFTRKRRLRSFEERKKSLRKVSYPDELLANVYSQTKSESKLTLNDDDDFLNESAFELKPKKQSRKSITKGKKSMKQKEMEEEEEVLSEIEREETTSSEDEVEDKKLNKKVSQKKTKQKKVMKKKTSQKKQTTQNEETESQSSEQENEEERKPIKRTKTTKLSRSTSKSTKQKMKKQSTKELITKEEIERLEQQEKEMDEIEIQRALYAENMEKKINEEFELKLRREKIEYLEIQNRPNDIKLRLRPRRRIEDVTEEEDDENEEFEKPKQKQRRRSRMRTVSNLKDEYEKSLHDEEEARERKRLRQSGEEPSVMASQVFVNNQTKGKRTKSRRKIIPVKKETTEKIYVYLSGFDSDTKEEYKKELRSIPLLFVTEYITKATHVVCLNYGRTYNMLYGICKGLWILDERWIDAVLTMEGIVEEEEYECDKYNGCKEQRMNTRKLFEGYQFKIGGFDPKVAKIRMTEIKTLIQLMGGVFIDDEDKIDVLLGTEPGTIKFEWLFDCISQNQCLLIDEYEN